jgi:8-oxo-dGTP pyrophosphatase MutT (NUDIX family)
VTEPTEGGEPLAAPDPSQDPENPWRTLESRVVYANSWMTVREDSVIRPDGQPGIYGVVEIRPSVGIVALDDASPAHGQPAIALVRQWRYTLGRTSLEIPTGGSEPGETLLDAAARELAEETGLAASSWVPLGSIDNSNGVTTDVSHMFLARALAPVPGEPARGDGKRGQGDESIELTWLPFGEALERVLSGEITESVSVAAIVKAAVFEAALVNAAQVSAGQARAPGGRAAGGRASRARR